MYSFVQDPVGSLQELPNTLVSNWQPVATGVGGAISALALVSRTYSQKKEEAQEIQSNLQGEVTTLSEAKAKVEGQVEAQKTTIQLQADQLKVKEAKITELNQTINQKDAAIKQLTWEDHHIKKKDKDEIIQEVLKQTRKP